MTPNDSDGRSNVVAMICASSIVFDPHGRWVAFASEAGARIVDVVSGKGLLVVNLELH